MRCVSQQACVCHVVVLYVILGIVMTRKITSQLLYYDHEVWMRVWTRQDSQITDAHLMLTPDPHDFSHCATGLPTSSRRSVQSWACGPAVQQSQHRSSDQRPEPPQHTRQQELSHMREAQLPRTVSPPVRHHRECVVGMQAVHMEYAGSGVDMCFQYVMLVLLCSQSM